MILKKPTYEELNQKIKKLEKESIELKRTEEALRESTERIETILLSLPIGIMIVDSDTNRIIDANPQAMLMIETPIEKIVGSKCYQYSICSKEENKCPITDFGQQIDKKECALLTASGGNVPILKSVIPSVFDGRKCFIEGFIDISGHKRAESERIQKEKLQGIMEMAGAVCHEMNQPLMGIHGYSELISMDMSENDPLQGNVAKMKEQVDKLGEITQKLMKITRYETKDYLNGKIVDIDKAAE
jgi:signal transduction histidine kinase